MNRQTTCLSLKRSKSHRQTVGQNFFERVGQHDVTDMYDSKGNIIKYSKYDNIK